MAPETLKISWHGVFLHQVQTGEYPVLYRDIPVVRARDKPCSRPSTWGTDTLHLFHLPNSPPPRLHPVGATPHPSQTHVGALPTLQTVYDTVHVRLLMDVTLAQVAIIVVGITYEWASLGRLVGGWSR